jgi:hypothetical protein
MTSEHLGNGKNEMRVELKYCERCGVLWLRDPSTGHVYCDHCRPRMDELPAQRKRRGSIRLTCGKCPVVQHYKGDIYNANRTALRILGGVA